MKINIGNKLVCIKNFDGGFFTNYQSLKKNKNYTISNFYSVVDMEDTITMDGLGCLTIGIKRKHEYSDIYLYDYFSELEDKK